MYAYADDNQLFISFVTSEFSINLSHLQAAGDLVSQSSNLLSLNLLNFPKLPFLIQLLAATVNKWCFENLLLRHHFTKFLSTQSWYHL